jgi:hypothetical protein
MAVGVGLVAALMIAAAGSIALVALSLAVDEALLLHFPPAEAAALTAAVFAAICALLAFVAPRMIAAWREAPTTRSSTFNLATVFEIALAVGAGVAEASRRRRDR